jgi:hypothetical protein
MHSHSKVKNEMGSNGWVTSASIQGALFSGQMGSLSFQLCDTLPSVEIAVKNLYKFGVVGVYWVKP